MSSLDHMRIGELARSTGTTTRALRYYETQGLLEAPRTGNGYRDYDQSHLRQVRQIQELQAVGFALEDTRPFVECLRAGNASGDSCPDSVAVYRRKLAEVAECIDALEAVRTELTDKLAAAERGRCPRRNRP